MATLTKTVVFSIAVSLWSCKDDAGIVPTMTGKWLVEYSHQLSEKTVAGELNPLRSFALVGTMYLFESNGDLGGTLTGVEDSVLYIIGSVSTDLSVTLSASTARSHYTISGTVNNPKTHFLGQLSGSTSARMEATKE